MNKMDKLRIGLALNGIAQLVGDEIFERIKGRLNEIEDIVSSEPTDNEEPMAVTRGCVTCKHGYGNPDKYPCYICVFSKWESNDKEETE